MLYIYVIQKRESLPEVYSSYLSAATRCQSHISAIAEKGSLSERYCLVLEELRIEALRQTKSMDLFLSDLGGIESQQNGFHVSPIQVDDSSSTTIYNNLTADT